MNKRKSAIAFGLAMAICLSACSGNQNGASSTTSSATVSENTSAEAAAVTETTPAETTAAETSETADTDAAEDFDFSDEDEEFELLPIPDDLTGGKPWIDSNIIGNVTADNERAGETLLFVCQESLFSGAYALSLQTAQGAAHPLTCGSVTLHPNIFPQGCAGEVFLF